MRRFLEFILLLAIVVPSSVAAERPGSAVRIEVAYAVSEDPANPLGAAVLPDRFVIHAIASTPWASRWDAGDYFFAVLEVGTAANPTKYGATTAVKFTLRNGWQNFTVVNPPGCLLPGNPPKKLHRRYYELVSEPQTISCDPANKLLFRVSGDSADTLRMTVRTAMHPGLTVRQGDLAAGDQNYCTGAEQRQYSCLLRQVPQ